MVHVDKWYFKLICNYYNFKSLTTHIDGFQIFVQIFKFLTLALFCHFDQNYTNL